MLAIMTGRFEFVNGFRKKYEEKSRMQLIELITQGFFRRGNRERIWKGRQWKITVIVKHRDLSKLKYDLMAEIVIRSIENAGAH